MNQWYAYGQAYRPAPSSGLGCLAWIGILSLVGFAMFFCLCVAVVGVAAASSGRDRDPDPVSDEEPEPETTTPVPTKTGSRRVCDEATTKSMPKRPRDAAEGKAGTLVGDVCAIEIFASGDNVRWSKNERVRELQDANKAYVFLERQAKSYGKDLHVVRLDMDGDAHVPDMTTNTSTGYVEVPLAEIETKLGRSLESLIVNAKKEKGCKQAHAVLHVKVAEEPKFSHAECGSGRDAEYAVVAHRQAGMLIAHEVLHLYGAWDLYHLDDWPWSPQTRAQEQKLQKLFPNDVMSKDIYGSKIDVGELTAWLVGWTACAEPSYPGFRPSNQ